MQRPMQFKCPHPARHPVQKLPLVTKLRTCNSGNNDVSTENSLTLATASTEDNKIRAKVNPEVLAATVEIPVSDNSVCENTDDAFWVKVGKCTLLMSDKECLLTPGSSLTDKHINFAQTLLRSQYPSVSGLTSTLLQYKSLPTKLAMGLQMIHCRSSHWVTAYKEDSSSEVKVYNSLFDSVDDITETVIMNVFEVPKIKMAKMQSKQQVQTTVDYLLSQYVLLFC